MNSIHCHGCGSNITEEGMCTLCIPFDPIKYVEKPQKDRRAEGYNDGLLDKTVSNLNGNYLRGYSEGQKRRLEGL